MRGFVMQKQLHSWGLRQSNQFKLAGIAVSLCALAFYSSAARAGTLYSYDLVVTNQLTINSGDIQGTTFVDNLLSNDQPTFATSSSLAGTEDTLDVAGNVTIGSNGEGLTVNNGTFRHHFALPSGIQLNLNGNRPDITDSSLSITPLVNMMNNMATYYNSLSATTLTPSGQNLNINPTGTGLNVYTISASALAASNLNVTVNLANATQGALIEVTGSSFTFGSSEHLTVNAPGGDTTPDSQVLWYFPTATTVNLQDSIWNGALLAPSANLTDNNQDVMGGVYVQNFTETAEIHLPTPNSLFNAPVPEPASLLILTAATSVAALRRRKRA
jgi:choice-of-anchor A domain-containing protein